VSPSLLLRAPAATAAAARPAAAPAAQPQPDSGAFDPEGPGVAGACGASAGSVCCGSASMTDGLAPEEDPLYAAMLEEVTDSVHDVLCRRYGLTWRRRTCRLQCGRDVAFDQTHLADAAAAFADQLTQVGSADLAALYRAAAAASNLQLPALQQQQQQGLQLRQSAPAALAVPCIESCGPEVQAGSGGGSLLMMLVLLLNSLSACQVCCGADKAQAAAAAETGGVLTSQDPLSGQDMSVPAMAGGIPLGPLATCTDPSTHSCLTEKHNPLLAAPAAAAPWFNSGQQSQALDTGLDWCRAWPGQATAGGLNVGAAGGGQQGGGQDLQQGSPAPWYGVRGSSRSTCGSRWGA